MHAKPTNCDAISGWEWGGLLQRGKRYSIRTESRSHSRTVGSLVYSEVPQFSCAPKNEKVLKKKVKYSIVGVGNEVERAGNVRRANKQGMPRDTESVHTFQEGKWWEWGTTQG